MTPSGFAGLELCACSRQRHLSAGGTSRSTCSTCAPQPAHVGFEHTLQVTLLHIMRLSWPVDRRAVVQPRALSPRDAAPGEDDTEHVETPNSR